MEAKILRSGERPPNVKSEEGDLPTPGDGEPKQKPESDEGDVPIPGDGEPKQKHPRSAKVTRPARKKRKI